MKVILKLKKLKKEDCIVQLLCCYGTFESWTQTGQYHVNLDLR